jgi:glycosyltransferase involved in cell wall biosynthesis
MTVLLVSGDFTTCGGMDRANYELAWYLADQAGAGVELVAHHVAEPLASHSNVTWRRVPRPLNSSLLGSPLLAQYGRAAARRIRAREGAVVVNGGNCPWPDVNWVHAVQHAWPRRVAHAPAHIRARQWFSRKMDLYAEMRALRIARVIVVNSEQTRSRLIEDLGVPSHRVHTIYFGTDPQVFHPPTQEERLGIRQRLGWPERTLTAVFVGTLGYDRNKGFDVLFSAWQQLCADLSWDVDLVAAGAGAEVEFWQEQAAAAGLAQRIKIIGSTRRIPEILQAANVLVHPAFYEAYGLSVHEALCCGIPALVTRTAGIAERYPQSLQDLLLDHPPSVANLTDRLRHWRVSRFDYDDRAQKFSAKLRGRTWTDMAKEFVERTMPSLANQSHNGSPSQLARFRIGQTESSLPGPAIQTTR